MTKARIPIKKGKTAAPAFMAELDAEAKEILRMIESIANARGDTSRLVDSLQLLFAARAAIEDEVVFPHADEHLTKREHREALARAQLRAAVVDALMSRVSAIDNVPTRKAWCALAGAEAAALFADERKLRIAFRPADLRTLHQNATSIRAEVAEAFGQR